MADRNTLYLTAEERRQFDALPKELREGWALQDETITFADSPEKLQIRLSLMRLHDPRLREFQEQVRAVQTVEQLTALMEKTSLAEMSQGDLAELFFAMGPHAISAILGKLIADAKTDADLETVAALSTLRNTLLSSLQPA